MRFTGRESHFDSTQGGLLAIGKAIEDRYPDMWHVVATNRLYLAGTSPWENNELDRRDTDQRRGYQSRGYCVSGTTSTGRWFNTITDSIDRQGTLAGTMHPNIYAQLFYASKAYAKLLDVHDAKVHDRDKSCNPSSKFKRKREELVHREHQLEEIRSRIFLLNKRLDNLADAYTNDYDRYNSSLARSPRRNIISQNPANRTRNYWGSEYWRRDPEAEYPTIREFHEIESQRKAAIDKYEILYEQREASLQAFKGEYKTCYSVSPILN